MEYSLFFTVWSWMGLGAAIVLLIIAFATDIFRMDLKKARFFDPAWLAWIGAVAYMLHNVEEYGIDITGTTLAFPAAMQAMGMHNISEIAYLSCNLTLVWMVGPLLAYTTRKYRGIAPSMAVFALVNGLSHIGQAINLRAYNPGLLTSIIIFLPLAAWTIYICFGKGRMTWSVFAGVFSVAVLYSAILLAGILLAKNGVIIGITQASIMLFDAVLAYYLWYRLGKSGSKQLVG